MRKRVVLFIWQKFYLVDWLWPQFVAAALSFTHPLCCSSSIQLAVRLQAEVWPLLTDMRFVFRTCCWGIEFILHDGLVSMTNIKALEQHVLVSVSKNVATNFFTEKIMMKLLRTHCKCVCLCAYVRVCVYARMCVFDREPELNLSPSEHLIWYEYTVSYACMCASKYMSCLHFSVHKNEFACEGVVFKACCHGVKQSKNLADWWPPARERSPSEVGWEGVRWQ